MSKFILFDFECQSCQHVFDDMVKPDVHSAPCPRCAGDSKRLISAPRLDPRMGLDLAGNPTMAAKWEKIRKDRAKREAQHYKEHGTDMTPGADTAG